MRETTFGGLDVRITGGPDRDGGGDGPVVVLLHGFGAPGDDLVSLWRVLDVPREVRFVFPAAPLTFDTGFGLGRAWWMIDMERMHRAILSGLLRDLSAEVPEGLAEAHAKLVAMLDEMQASLGVTGERTVLGGFSQGAMLSLDVALRTERPLGALALMSGTLIAEAEWTPLLSRRTGLRVMQSHGSSDPMLPFSIAERLRDLMKGAGMQVDWVPFRGGHEIPPTIVDHLSALVRLVKSP